MISVLTFASDEIAPRAAEIDRTDRFPDDLWRKMGDLGVLGITVEEEWGGAGMGYLEHMVGEWRRSSRASASVGLSYGAHSNLCVNQIRLNGTREQERTASCRSWCRARSSALSRCRSRGRAPTWVSMRSRAEKRGDRYILNGTKMWITNGPRRRCDGGLRQDRPGGGVQGHHCPSWSRRG